MARGTKSERRATRRAYIKAAGKYPVGEGSRFKAVAASAKAGGASNPAAVAAAIGRKKYGAKKMAAMATAGKK
jgi:hypothetical protein